ncbi:hypothetical protein FRC00_011472 [Tulasnella sp. 408]|nr:hypothetical protein FRC00_011472 [Tulasnella sp. 408]
MLASFLLLAAAAASAHAHSVMQQIIVDGKAQGALTGIRVPAKNSPVVDVESNDIICNANLRSPLPGDVIDVKGGSKVGIEWHRTIGKLSSDVISKSHRGPIQVYLAKVDSATQEDVTGLNWFKVAEQGFDAGSNTWATDDLIKNKGVFDFTVPSCIEEGDYIMRADITALHNARPNKANGAQIYIGCSQFKVSGTDGSAKPSTVSFPGAYNPDDEYTGDDTGDDAGEDAGDNTTTSAADATSTSESATKTSTKTTKTKTKTETATVTAAAFAKRDSSTNANGHPEYDHAPHFKAQIVFLMSTLTEDNFERNQAEIRTLSETHGIETYLHFIRRLIVASQQRLAPSASPYDNNSALTFRLLVQEVQRLARDPFLADRFRDGIDRAEGEIFRHFDLLRFMDRVGLRPLEKLIIASSIVSTNNARKELAAQANQIIRLEWTNAVLSLCTRPSFDHADLTPSQVAKLLSNLLSDPPSDMPVLDTQQRHEILVAAWSKYGQDVMSPILQQILPSLSLPPGTSLVQALNQLGPDLTCDPDVIRAMLLRFGVSDATPPQTKQVVEILATMARSALEGKQLCDVAALTRALGTFRPSLHWPTIIRALDEPERTGVDTATLKLTIAVLLNAPRDVDAHAVSGFWSIWNNTTWQVKLLDSLLSLPGDTFNFVTLPGRRTVTVDDVAGASPTIKALAANVQGHTWNSLDLIETLVKLGDLDVAETKTCVRELLDKGVRISAELVHMGLLQVPITAHFFGSLIQYELINSTPLGIAVRFVLDALRYPPDANLFKFGVTALAKFESRLYKWPDLCRTLLALPNLQEARPDLIDTAQRIVAQADAGQLGPNGSVLGDVDQLPLPFQSIRPDPISEPIEEPEVEQSDKILFIINNLAPSNFEQKAAEMKERFKDEHARWLANYLVDQRVSTEPNNHELYLRLLDSLQRKPVFRFVLHETFVKAANLLNSDQTLSSATDRTVLKNLASWLGALTLARDRPIKHKNISFKDLLLEGYDNNRLLVAIPFVCKILEHGKNSVVFRPPNPWLMGVISLLAELYHFAELRLNDKFEIEVTCRALDIELDKVEATTILRNRPMTDPMQAPQLPDYVHDIDSMPMGSYDATQPPAQQTILPSQMGSSSPSPQVSVAIEAILNGLPAMVVVNPQLGPYATNPVFKRACQMAVDHAVREIIMPVIERSVTIAGISTRELVTKDYALEVNEEKMRKAAQLMAQNLAGNLAMVTCKEPLRSNMITHLRLMLTEHGFGDNIPDQAIQLIVNDNVDIACTVIEKAAMDRAAAEVEDAFTDAYNARRNHRETRPNQPFWDTSSQLSPFLATLPDILRIKPTGLQQQQTRVYDEFGREGARVAISRPGSVNVVREGYGASTPASEAIGAWSHQICMDRFTQLATEAERVMAVHGLSQNDAQNFIRQVVQFAGKSPDPDQTTLAFSQKTVQLMFKTDLQVARELYALLLAKMCEVWPKVAKEAIDWLLYAEDPRKFNVPVTLTLIRLRVIAAPDYDMPLSKQVAANMTGPVVAFAVSLLREAIFGDQPCATRNHFANTIEALGRTVTANKSTPEILRLLEDVGVRRPAPADNDVYETLLHHFAEWVRIYQRAPSSEKAFVSWVTQVTAQGILRGEDLSSLFYRVCVESSIQMYNKCIASGEPILAFQPIDALARLIVLMIKYNGDASSSNSVPTKVHYLSKILSIVVLVLARAHEDDTVEFKQRPFFRLFSSLLADLHSIESQLHVAYFPLLIAICDTFNTLQPIFFPGFAFSWMSLISHRLFLPKLLLTENRDGWGAFHRLLLSLFRFLSPFLKNASMHNAVGTLYRGSLSVLLVLLHDFPEFLTEYYFTLCDAIPPRCVQLRNIILSAYPPQLQIPDPYPRDLKLDSLPDMGPIPPILSDFTSALSPEIRNLLDAQLMGRGNTANTLTLIKQAITLPGNPPDDGSAERYNIHVMNAVVMFVGVSSVAQAKARTGSSLFVGSDPGVVLLQQLASDLDAEGQHHLIGSFGIHLRYPNAHTHWFSSLVLHLFKEINAGKYQEITTKVLFERFLVHRPHPWGLIVTFIELLRNPRYDFWNKEFLGVSPEITDLLKHVRLSSAV